MKAVWIRRKLKKSPRLASSKRALWAATGRILRGCDTRITEEFPLFSPYSAGSLKDRAQLTVQAANQTFPFMVELVSLLREKEFEDPVPIESLSDSDRNRSAAAQLKALFDKYGSDKATPHGYHHLYGSILVEPDSVTDIIEVGVGSKNKHVVSNMGLDARPGASLRAFSDFLPRAQIYGADIDKTSLFEDERIRTFFVDQTAPRSFDSISAAINKDFDLIIDDGLHSPNANIATLMFALKRLKKGGWFVVEDIAPSALPVWRVISALLPQVYEHQLIVAKRSLLFAVKRQR